MNQAFFILVVTFSLGTASGAASEPTANEGLQPDEAKRLKFADDAGKVVGTLGFGLFILFMFWRDKKFNDNKKEQAHKRELEERNR